MAVRMEDVEIRKLCTDTGKIRRIDPKKEDVEIRKLCTDTGKIRRIDPKKEDVEIVKARTDKREYRRIVLNNSLEVLLISDPDTYKCAAAMNVGVGSFSDPEGLEGLAHLLEHMLFYGSEKYPVEDGFSKYITENGGSTNAFTSSECTNYHFDVNTDCFEEALDRFAQFFIKPSILDDAVKREIKAVDSENRKNFLSDCWKMNQLQKHVSLEGHPYHKFSTGNWDTLEVRPKARGIDTRLELIKFYKENYSANLMHLVVYAKENLDKIQNLVKDKFQNIRNTDRNSFHCPGQPCALEHLEILVRTVPIKEGHKLRIIWPITPEIRHYKEGPCGYLGHLIGHEGEGSLFYILKALGWATGISAGETDWTLEFSFFKVVIDLTDAGHENMQHIIGLLFKYIQLLLQSGICDWIFDELEAVCKTKFHYQDKIPPIHYVVNVASNMQIYPSKDWLVGSSLPSIFNPITIKAVLEELSISNVRIFWESKKFEGHCFKFEPWYETAYVVEKITGSMIEAWMLSAPNENLHLPAANEFICTDLSLKSAKEKVEFPFLLRKSSYSRLWYKPDTMFSTPKAYVKIDFNCPDAGNSSKAEVLTDIFTRLLMDDLNENAYNAQVAGLYCGINHAHCGFQVTLDGYNHKLRILLEAVVKTIARFKVKSDRFSVIKEMVMKEYGNFKFQQPYQQAMYYCSLILQDHTWPWTEKVEVLPLLEAVDLEKFAPEMLSSAFLECYIAGNVETSEAESMIQHIEDVFFSGPNPVCRALFPSQHATNRVVKLKRGMSYSYPVEGLNRNDENSALVHYIQVHHDDFALNVKLQLFALIAKQPTFHQLRSVEQLGYITELLLRNDFGVHGVQFIIQSTVKDPGKIDSSVEALLKTLESKFHGMPSDEFKKGSWCFLKDPGNIDSRAEEFPRTYECEVYEMTNDKFKDPGNIDSRVVAFLKTFASKLYVMTSDEFQSNLNGLIDVKLEKHKNLREESEFYWREIYDGTLKFDRRETEVAKLRQLEQEELVHFFNENIKVDAPRRRTLSVGVYGKQHSSEYTADKSETQRYSMKIDDICSFRRSQPLYGSLRSR